MGAAERQAQRRRRFLNAGLDLLGGPTPAEELKVREICAKAGLAVRYFYENFADKDAFVAAVFDSVTGHLTASVQSAVAAAPPADRNRAGINALVHNIRNDPRIARLLFCPHMCNAVVIRKRAQQTRLLTTLAHAHLRQTAQLGADIPERLLHTHANFIVGGVRQALAAWQPGGPPEYLDELVDHLTAIVNGFGFPTY